MRRSTWNDGLSFRPPPQGEILMMAVNQRLRLWQHPKGGPAAGKNTLPFPRCEAAHECCQRCSDAALGVAKPLV